MINRNLGLESILLAVLTGILNFSQLDNRVQASIRYPVITIPESSREIQRIENSKKISNYIVEFANTISNNKRWYLGENDKGEKWFVFDNAESELDYQLALKVKPEGESFSIVGLRYSGRIPGINKEVIIKDNSLFSKPEGIIPIIDSYTEEDKNSEIFYINEKSTLRDIERANANYKIVLETVLNDLRTKHPR